MLGVRLVWLTLVAGPANAEKAAVTRMLSIELPAKRGTIYDRNGVVLATSVDAVTVYCNPFEVTDPTGESAQLAAILGGASTDYVDVLQTPDTTFAYVYRKADIEVAEKLEALELDGIYMLDDSKRVYPCGTIAGQVVGICDVDGNGLSGLELYYDDLLGGDSGSLNMERGANGYPIAGGLYERVEPRDGEDIVISIDVDMQEYLENRLVQEVGTRQGKSGNALVYDGGTGEILAIASTPYLNPQDRDHIKEGSTELKSITTAFEPGSIFKTVSAAAILEEGIMETSDTIFCPAELPANEYIVSDAHDRGDETMTFRQIIRDSSNVGISLATEKMGFDKLYDYILRYNLNDLTGVDYPGEASGFCTDVSTWTQIQCYNVSFGQGISVTPLQMARFYGALVNDGVECTPHFLMSKPQTGEKVEYKTTQVIKNTDAIAPLTSMLKDVVAAGTGVEAQIEGYNPAGKTGTAEYASEGGSYVRGYYNISFIGYLPDTDSQLVCFVGATEVPGDRITTPAFSDIMSYAIDHYGITSQ
ncbi:MAG: penicillin-binding protein 2 [Eggerthellaceae bacterium]|nr:penicillin-binding protein 2 [Eggerthellaceae bacterium]